MKTIKGFPQTYLSHPYQWRFKKLLDDMFIRPHPDSITEASVSFLRQYPLPLDDFPMLENTYSRTMLARGENGYEAMAARWCADAVSSVHGHPDYSFLIVVHGKLLVDNYEKTGPDIRKISDDILEPGQFISARCDNSYFDNHIHGVKAIEETLSIHISSRDATKGEVFHMAGQTF